MGTLGLSILYVPSVQKEGGGNHLKELQKEFSWTEVSFGEYGCLFPGLELVDFRILAQPFKSDLTVSECFTSPFSAIRLISAQLSPSWLDAFREM